jgi:hypothetical protein
MEAQMRAIANTAEGPAKSPKPLLKLATAAGLAVTLALAGCASPTPYQPIRSASSSQGGYSETQIDRDYWRVNFRGNTLTSRETVEGYLLYRAAELTLQQGNDWFEVYTRDVERTVREEPVRSGFYDPWWGYSYWRPRWSYYYRPRGWRAWDPYWGDPFFDTREVERYEATAEIAMHDGPVPRDGRRVFDAREVIDRLGPRIQRPQD